MDTNTKTNYEEMYPEEFKSAFNANPIAFLPLGSMEYHGYQNVLGLDSLKAWKICQLAAKEIGGIVFPPLYLRNRCLARYRSAKIPKQTIRLLSFGCKTLSRGA